MTNDNQNQELTDGFHLVIDALKANDIDTTIKQLRAVSRGLRHAAACPAPSHAECPTFQGLLKAAADGALARQQKLAKPVKGLRRKAA